jgi:hypothetical protein
MNDVLWLFLRRFILVFFDDVLIYRSSWAEYLQHILSLCILFYFILFYVLIRNIITRYVFIFLEQA